MRLSRPQAAASQPAGFIDQYMGGQFAINMKCVEAEGEPEVTSEESFYQLSCFIDKEVKYLHTGLVGVSKYLHTGLVEVSKYLHTGLVGVSACTLDSWG